MSNRDEQSYRMFENSVKMMYRGLLVFVCMFLLFSCRSPRDIIQTTEKEKIEIVYKDSIRYFDSTVITPVERYVDLVREYDTLKLSTSLASAEAWLDTVNSCLRGTIYNKNTYTYEKEVIDHYIVKDSISYVEKPVTYETIKYVKNPVNKVTATISIVFFLMLLVFILRTFLK